MVVIIIIIIKQLNGKNNEKVLLEWILQHRERKKMKMLFHSFHLFLFCVKFSNKNFASRKKKEVNFYVKKFRKNFALNSFIMTVFLSMNEAI